MALKDLNFQEIGIIGGSGAVAGLAAYEMNKYAATTKKDATTGKMVANIPELVKYPWISGAVLAGVGIALVYFGGTKLMMKEIGLGLVAGGLSVALADEMAVLPTTSGSGSTNS